MGEATPPKELEVADIVPRFTAQPIPWSGAKERTKATQHVYTLILISIGGTNSPEDFGAPVGELAEVVRSCRYFDIGPY